MWQHLPRSGHKSGKRQIYATELTFPASLTLMPDTATTAFNRFALGARFDLNPADRSRISADPRGWLKSVAQPDTALLTNPDLQDSTSNLVAIFQQDQMEKQAREAKLEIAAANAPQMFGPPAPKPAVQNKIFMAEAQARYQKAFDDPNGFTERLVWFWSNHFCISVSKGNQAMATAGSFEREAIRPFVLGKFADMLRTVEQHPAMLYFLDNRDSQGPDSKGGQKSNKGLNENLAREIMELHTLGVGSGYSQTDVTSLARVITGWTYPGLNNNNHEPGRFFFANYTHEPGPQKVLGKAYAQNDIAQGEAVLNDLARHPATAHHIAFKLARHFVADQPPQALVQKLAKVFLDTEGDLKAVTFALIDDDAAWNAPLQKLRSPQEYLLAASRALNLPPHDPKPLVNALNALGQPLWRPSGPNGFGDQAQDWASAEGMKTRLSYASQMAKSSPVPGNPIDLANIILADAASPDTRQTVSRAESKQQGLALLIMSPEFQRR